MAVLNRAVAASNEIRVCGIARSWRLNRTSPHAGGICAQVRWLVLRGPSRTNINDRSYIYFIIQTYEAWATSSFHPFNALMTAYPSPAISYTRLGVNFTPYSVYELARCLTCEAARGHRNEN